MASGSPIVFDFVSDIALGSMFEVDPLSKEAYAQANESLPKILYLITLQFAVLLSLVFLPRISRLRKFLEVVVLKIEFQFSL